MFNFYKNLAEINGWHFEYSREDFQNLIDEENDNKVFLFVDPIVTDSKFSDVGNETITYSGKFMILLNSDIDEDYKEKVEHYINVVKTEYLQVIKDELACDEYQINSFKTLEVINLFDQNLDGVLVNYSITLLD